MALLSVLIPARNERYIGATVADLLSKAVGNLEVVVVLDGAPYPELPNDHRVAVIRHEQPAGMRPSINEAAAFAQGDVFLKCDAHCLFAPGFDLDLLRTVGPGRVVVPRRYSLDPVRWAVIDADPPRDYHYLAWPFSGEFAGTRESGEAVLRGRTWHQRAIERAHVVFDDELTSQGSCWVMLREHWIARVGPLDTEHYGPFIQEFQEVGMKTWLSGGAVKINKSTWYAHWYKRKGQGYRLSKRQTHMGIAYSFDHWFNDRDWPGKVRSFRSLIDQFSPMPGWPADWQQWQRREAA